ncbi:nitroreductase family protein [Pigmentiphaga aceris]|uniref:Nitroreductase family protein n=1 Tax=Pigmentiphaga aceris TaxID=1940612 RepID=A0A5C0B0B2_9BURK|nr:nitroreductase family protein [Pigmentiphaga aceris]QEI08169.1 nitroreductase family protein [Pigmentiphaga aceris]
MTTSANSRQSEHPISPIFLERWSPRAFTGENIPEAELLTILDAARWAPSSYNFQPWRFLYARRGTPNFERYLAILNEFNRGWGHTASAILIIASKKTSQAPGAAQATPNLTHSLDTGAAWGYLALQASLSGWHAHGLGGFDRDLARSELNIPDDYTVEAAAVIGRLGDKSLLPEGLQGGETPSPRRPLAQVAFEGNFVGE